MEESNFLGKIDPQDSHLLCDGQNLVKVRQKFLQEQKEEEKLLRWHCMANQPPAKKKKPTWETHDWSVAQCSACCALVNAPLPPLFSLLCSLSLSGVGVLVLFRVL